MLAVIGCLALIIVVLAGIGALIAGQHRPADITFGGYAVLGFVPVMIAGSVLNFLTPLTHHVAVATVAAGVIAFAIRRHQIWSSLGTRPLLMLTVVCALLLAIAAGAVMTPPAYDTGLYHLQAIEWLEQSTTIFGLANLHLRFGTNSSWFTATAMFDLPAIARRGVFLLNPALLLATLAAVLQPAIEWRESDSPQRLTNIFAATVAVVLLVNAKLLLFHWIGASPNYDLPSALLLILAFWAFIRASEKDAVNEAAAARAQLALMLAACVLAVAVKLSALPILLLIPAALLPLYRGGHLSVRQLLGDPVIAFVGGGGAAWLASGIVSSGCFVFPAAVTCISGLPWAVPTEQVHEMADTVTGWARSPNRHYLEALTGWAWLRSWPSTVLAVHRPFLERTAATLAILVLLVGAVAIRGRRGGTAPAVAIRNRSVALAITYAIATSCIGVAFWFVTAPDPRLGLGFLIATPALFVAWAAWRWVRGEGLIHRAWSGSTIAGFVFLFCGAFLMKFGRAALIGAQSWPHIPVAVVSDQALGERFHANVPVSGDQCWDAPLPCTPGFSSPALREGQVLWWRSIESGERRR